MLYLKRQINNQQEKWNQIPRKVKMSKSRFLIKHIEILEANQTIQAESLFNLIELQRKIFQENDE